MSGRLGALACCIALLSGVGQAHAQSLDYHAYEDLFGESVTMSVTGSPQRVSEVPATMEIITSEDIRRSGATDIPGVLRHVAGIDILRWTANSVDVSVRGYDQAFSSRLLVLVNGRQVYADHFGYTPWSSLPVELPAIHQIEVVKGPNSALFGFNAVGGVINIITHNPLYYPVNRISVTGGTQEHLQGSGIATLKLGERGGIMISAGLRRDDDFSTVPRTQGGFSRGDTNRVAVSVDGRFRLSDNIEFGFEATHTEADQTNVIYLYSLFYEPSETNSAKGYLSADTSLGILKATFYHNWIDIRSAPLKPLIFPVRLNSGATVAQLQDIFKLGARHTFRISGEYRDNGLDSTPIEGGHVRYQVFALSGMWNWRVTPDLSITNAVRMDHLMLERTGFLPSGFGLTNDDWDRNVTQVSFNSGAVWKAGDLDDFRLTIARGAQLPSLYSLGGLLINLAVLPGSALGGFASGLPSLQPAKTMNYEIGWDHDLEIIHGRLQIDLFHSRTRDVIANTGSNLLSAGIVSAPANIGNSEATGIELSLEGAFPANWRWRVDYRYEQVKDRFPGFAATETLVDYKNSTPAHLLNAALGWSEGAWEIDGYLRYQSRTQGFQDNLPVSSGFAVPVPDYVSIDGRIAYSLTDAVTLSLSGQNLSKHRQVQTSGPAVGRRVFATISFGY